MAEIVYDIEYDLRGWPQGPAAWISIGEALRQSKEALGDDDSSIPVGFLLAGERANKEAWLASHSIKVRACCSYFGKWGQPLPQRVFVFKADFDRWLQDAVTNRAQSALQALDPESRLRDLIDKIELVKRDNRALPGYGPLKNVKRRK